MGQHYTQNTIEVPAWCNKCGKMTRHRVADKRLQFCIPCWETLGTPKAASDPEKKKPPAQQSLFDTDN